MKNVYIFATKDKRGEFYGEHFSTDLNNDLGNLEYSDVSSDQFQMWEYPSGKIYKIESDRKLSNNESYSTPVSGKEVVWIPKLTHIATDTALVSRQYDILSNTSSAPTLLTRILDRLRKLFK